MLHRHPLLYLAFYDGNICIFHDQVVYTLMTSQQESFSQQLRA
jgi:hypothetical protein